MKGKMSMQKRAEEKQVIFSSLKEALLQLLDQKSFKEITIRQLVKTVGIAISTFYRHFTDKLDFVRFLIQRKLVAFDRQYHPQTIKERFQKEYMREVWRYLLRDQRAVLGLERAGLSYLYLEELNKHLLTLYPYTMTTEEQIELLGLAGAQYNIIFNLFVKKHH